MAKTENPYDVLGVEPDADPVTIRRAYRGKAKAAHPDTGGSPEQFASLGRALAVLTNPERRKKFDETGDAGEEPKLDQTDAKARAMVAGVLDAIVENEKHDPMTIDVVALMTDCLTKGVKDARKQAKVFEKRIERCRKLEAKFKRKAKSAAGENILARLMRGKREGLEQMAKELANEIAAGDRAIEILGEHEFEWDQPPPPQPSLESALINMIKSEQQSHMKGFFR